MKSHTVHRVHLDLVFQDLRENVGHQVLLDYLVLKAYLVHLVPLETLVPQDL